MISYIMICIIICYIYDIERQRYFPKLLRVPTYHPFPLNRISKMECKGICFG